jgi:uncharacterized protein (TIGR00369 family)
MRCGLMKECVLDTEISLPEVDTSTLFSRVPFNRLLGLQREFCEAGQARMVLETRDELTNNFEATHGGVIMTLLDVAMSSAALSKSDFQRAVVTIDMSTSFVKPGRGRLVAHGTAVGGGRSVCFCEARIEDEAGELVAKAMGTFKYVQP